MSLLRNELYHASQQADQFVFELEVGITNALDKGYERGQVFMEIITLLTHLVEKGIDICNGYETHDC